MKKLPLDAFTRDQHLRLEFLGGRQIADLAGLRHDKTFADALPYLAANILPLSWIRI